MPNTIKGYWAAIFSSVVNGLKGIDVDHSYIHEGIKFEYSENFTLGTGTSKIISFTTPTTVSGKSVHFRPELVSTSADKLKIELYEGDVISGGSDKLTSIYNYNRQSTTTTSMQLFKTGTSQSTPGTKLLTSYIGGGTGVGQSKSGSETGPREEKLLAINTTYSLKFSNGSSGDNIINVIVSWYEQDS